MSDLSKDYRITSDAFQRDHQRRVNTALFNVAQRPDVHQEIEDAMKYSGVSRRSAEAMYAEYITPSEAIGTECPEVPCNATPPRTTPRRGIPCGHRESAKVFALLSLSCAVLTVAEMARHAVWSGNAGLQALVIGAIAAGVCAAGNWRAR